jgi:Pyruvate/2-oxoacid:ferredoxin oxidoreductase delta subunit
MSVSRRDLFSAFFPLKKQAEPQVQGSALPPMAIPAGFTLQVDPRRCLAQSAPCRACIEQCPHPGAVVLEEGWPAVKPSCTGCGLCVSICPSPTNAFRMIPRSLSR